MGAINGGLQGKSPHTDVTLAGNHQRTENIVTLSAAKGYCAERKPLKIKRHSARSI